MDELIWAKQGSWHRLWHRVGSQYTGGGTAAFCRESLLECAVGDGTKERGLGWRPSPGGRGDTGMKVFVCLFVFSINF